VPATEEITQLRTTLKNFSEKPRKRVGRVVLIGLSKGIEFELIPLANFEDLGLIDSSGDSPFTKSEVRSENLPAIVQHQVCGS
jgi:hypothetical protein